MLIHCNIVVNDVCRLHTCLVSMSGRHLGRLLAKRNVPKAHQGPARTRFAPSPTGHVHLGSLRTAIFNFLWAKHTGGQFLLRIEDTDRKRLVADAEDNIYRTLEWAQLTWDEGPLIGGPCGPYRQSERAQVYKKYASQLLKSGAAYRCFCSKERLTRLAESARAQNSTASYDRKCIHIPQEQSDQWAHEKRPFVIRFRSPSRYPMFDDLVHGDSISVQPQVSPLDLRYDDFTLVKSDGMPTYHFANVVDDHEMDISHVIRGEEWLPSTPKHKSLYEAFGWAVPIFAHLPLLLSADGQKLSKRRSDLSVTAIAETNSISPEALVNFAALLGWSPRHERVGTTRSEVMNMGELCRSFSIYHLTKGGIHLDMSKLEFFDQQHFRRLPHNEKVERCRNACERKNLHLPDDVSKLMSVIGDHVASVADFVSRMDDLVSAENGGYCPASLRPILIEALEILDRLESLNIHEAGNFISNLPFTRKKCFQALRCALLNSSPGISVAEVLTILGPQQSADRIRKTLHNCT